MSNIIDVTEANFDEEVKKSRTPVLIEFWASWCPPCKMMDNVLKSLDDECENLKIAKINIDLNKALANRFSIYGAPAFIFFKDNNFSEALIGSQSKNKLIEFINND